MLNELYELSKALEHHGLLRATTHPDIHNVGKGSCLLFELDRNGDPKQSRFLLPEESATLWKHSKGNHNNFPAIRVQKPLLSSGESDKISPEIWKKAKIKEKVELLGSLNFGAINSDGLDIKISDWSLKQLAPVLESKDPRLAALKQLITVFPRAEHSEEFQLRLTDFLRRKIAVCDYEVELDFIKELLVGSWNPKSEKYIAACMTYYDVYESESYPNLTISSETYQALVALLISKTNRVSKGGADEILSPLTGTRTVGIGDKYPNPNLPRLGQTYLFSKKSDTACLTRYCMSGPEAFQAGEQEVHAMNDAITFLTAKTRENKSWASISDSNGEKPNLLLAYLTADPQNDAYLARILGDPSDYETEEEYIEEAESAFDALCQQVLGKIDGVIRKNPKTKINMIVLETLDPGRKQVVYENVWTVEQFQKNLLSWAEAGKNHPEIEIRIRDKKQMISYKPLCPGPDEICKLLKVNYSRSGSAKVMNQSAVSLHEIYQLYMPQNDQFARDRGLLDNFISIVVRKASLLLGDVKHQMLVEYSLPPTKEATTLAKRTALFVSLISILLWRLDVRKEFYMLDAPYNIGQFLQLSDMLHKQYCIQVRNGGDERKPLPAQLIGNEMLAIASENPVEGLNRLRDRMRIYLAWASTVTGEGAGLAKWILARYGEVSAKIAANNLPEQFTPTQQAQVLLGYLAMIPNEKKVMEGNKNE